MKRSFGAALSLFLLMALSPLSAVAQQAQPNPLATDSAKSKVTDDDPLNPVWGPKDMMSMSGMFLGIVGMMGGAAIGGVIGQAQCEEGQKGCMGHHSFTGALVAGTFFVPIGVHLANKEPQNLLKSMAVSMLAGTAFYFSMKAIPGEPVHIAPFLAAPVQMVTSIRIESKK